MIKNRQNLLFYFFCIFKMSVFLSKVYQSDLMNFYVKIKRLKTTFCFLNEHKYVHLAKQLLKYLFADYLIIRKVNEKIKTKSAGNRLLYIISKF